MEKLLDLSACTLENCDDVLGMAAQKVKFSVLLMQVSSGHA